MEMIVLIGIPGSGKSSFYKENFFCSHMRVNLDMLRTRHREEQLLNYCFDTSLPMVIDNTNVTREEREKYIQKAAANGYIIKGYYFKSEITKCMERNNNRSEQERIPERGLLAKYNQLELPLKEEGFDGLYYVEINDNFFKVNDWKYEV